MKHNEGDLKPRFKRKSTFNEFQGQELTNYDVKLENLFHGLTPYLAKQKKKIKHMVTCD